jgi:DNA mismatch endonuclease, patch repair protein
MDTIEAHRRSENMRRIKSSNTSPERTIRSLVRSLGYTGYRLHRKDLPGKPDMAWIGRKIAIFVHGCFWHAHDCPEESRKPKSNTTYWLQKIENNRKRDLRQIQELNDGGWRILVIWECELKNTSKIRAKLQRFLSRQ